jgi:hypothetical protein
MRKEANNTGEQKIKEWQEFVIKNRDIFEKIAKNLEKRKR